MKEPVKPGPAAAKTAGQPRTTPATAEVPHRSTAKLPCFRGEKPLKTYPVQVQLAVKFNGWSAEAVAVIL